MARYGDGASQVSAWLARGGQASKDRLTRLSARRSASQGLTGGRGGGKEGKRVD